MEQIEDWREEEPNGLRYFQNAWFPVNDEGDDFHFCVVLVDGKYYASPVNSLSRKYDIGPFDTLEEAKAVSVTVGRMGGFDGPFPVCEE